MADARVILACAIEILRVHSSGNELISTTIIATPAVVIIIDGLTETASVSQPVFLI